MPAHSGTTTRRTLGAAALLGLALSTPARALPPFAAHSNQEGLHVLHSNQERHAIDALLEGFAQTASAGEAAGPLAHGNSPRREPPSPPEASGGLRGDGGQSVPAPSTLLIGLAGLAAARRRRSR